jgi:hypothetical protein
VILKVCKCFIIYVIITGLFFDVRKVLNNVFEGVVFIVFEDVCLEMSYRAFV